MKGFFFLCQKFGFDRRHVLDDGGMIVVSITCVELQCWAQEDPCEGDALRGDAETAMKIGWREVGRRRPNAYRLKGSEGGGPVAVTVGILAP